jgi:hypothetical protein
MSRQAQLARTFLRFGYLCGTIQGRGALLCIDHGHKVGVMLGLGIYINLIYEAGETKQGYL